MTAWIWATAWGLVDSFLKYRFLKKMLGVKYRCTFVWFYLAGFVYGQANQAFALSGTTWGNFFYLCGCALVLNAALFQGSFVKKSFFTIWMYCAPGIVICAIFPLLHALAVVNGAGYCSDPVIDAAGYASYAVQYLMMEILQRRLHLLKHDFRDRDAFYLMYMIIFIYAAVSTMLDMFTRVREWPENVVVELAFFCSLIAAAGSGLHVFCVMMLEQRLLERLARQQYAMLDRQLEASREQYDQLVKIRHDMKNHGLCLTKLLADKKTDEAVHYLEQLDIRMEQGDAPVQTGSVYVDALLNPKYQQAQRLGIDISIEMSVPGEENIAAVDLCCLVANALDNAVEACERGIRAGAPAGWIRMRSRMCKNYWVLEISNSIHTPVPEKHGKILSSKRLHFTGRPVSGVGLQNIRAVVERYEGVLEVRSEKIFSLHVMLPIACAAKKNQSASV